MTAPVDIQANRLSARGLSKSYGPVPALRDAGLDIARGEILAITGPSGSGKSTLLHCLAGIIRPDSGTVEFGGERIDSMSEDRRSRLRRSRFGILFQFGQLIPELTALDNVALPLLLNGSSRGPAKVAAKEWLTLFEVDDLADSKPGEMSGGQGQRVAMARAMITKPEVIFADEPTGSLDTLSGEQVLSALVRSATESTTSVVIVTHDARVAAYAQREVVVRDGVLEEAGVIR